MSWQAGRISVMLDAIPHVKSLSGIASSNAWERTKVLWGPFSRQPSAPCATWPSVTRCSNVSGTSSRAKQGECQRGANPCMFHKLNSSFEQDLSKRKYRLPECNFGERHFRGHSRRFFLRTCVRNRDTSTPKKMITGRKSDQKTTNILFINLCIYGMTDTIFISF